MKQEIERDYRHNKEGGTKMIWYPDREDAEIKTDEE